MTPKGSRKESASYVDGRDRPIVKNRRASFDYTIGDRYEAGIVLVGSEVKALRFGRVAIVDAFASMQRGELWLQQLHIGDFEMARSYAHAQRRPRKLLMHKREIVRIERALDTEGATLIPLSLYFKDGRVKVELGVAKGKKFHDKRQAIAEKTAAAEVKALIRRVQTGRR